MTFCLKTGQIKKLIKHAWMNPSFFPDFKHSNCVLAVSEETVCILYLFIPEKIFQEQTCIAQNLQKSRDTFIKKTNENQCKIHH